MILNKYQLMNIKNETTSVKLIFYSFPPHLTNQYNQNQACG